MSTGISNANSPVFSESEATGTTDAAESFTEFLENEEPKASNPRPPKRERREAPAAKDGADEGDDSPAPKARQPKAERDTDTETDTDPLRDPVLDGEDGDEPDTDDEDDEDADGDETDDTDDDEGDEDEGDEDPEFDVTVNGEIQKVKQSELIAGYSRMADYTQKTQELAEEREEVETFAQEVVKSREQHIAGIQLYTDLISAVMPSQEEWDALEKANPAEFIKAQKQWGGFLTKVEEAKAARDAAEAEKAAEAERSHNEYVKVENKKLLKALPQLGNPKVAKQFSAKIFAYGKRLGYTDAELKAGLINHRDVQTAYYAARYLEIQDSRKANSNKAKGAAPKAAEGNSNPRVTASPKAQRAARVDRRTRDADARLARTGDVRDAAEAFAGMFRNQ